MLRSLIFFLLAIIVLILSMILWLVMWIAHFFNKKAPDLIAHHFVRNVCRFFLWIAGGRVTAYGLENVPKDAPALVIANHRSIFDILILYAYSEMPMGFIAKKELKKVPMLAQWLLFARGLFLDRENIREGLKTIKKGVEYLQDGVSMCIFPEGTRNKDQSSLTSLLEFHGGSLKLAERAKVPIIPVAIYNSANIFENHKPFMKKTDVQITFGTPVPTDTLTKDDRRFLSERMQETIQEMLNHYET